jgi:hypothetical protein
VLSVEHQRPPVQASYKPYEVAAVALPHHNEHRYHIYARSHMYTSIVRTHGRIDTMMGSVVGFLHLNEGLPLSDRREKDPNNYGKHLTSSPLGT